MPTADTRRDCPAKAIIRYKDTVYTVPAWFAQETAAQPFADLSEILTTAETAARDAGDFMAKWVRAR